MRLRTFIKDKKFNEALSYLRVLPLKVMKPAIRMTFEGDGAEIVFGLITQHYNNAEYSRVISTWETYNDRYINKVAMDPFLNNLVAKSYLKLGLMDGFNKMFKRITGLKDVEAKNYPMWIERTKGLTRNLMIKELDISKNIKLENWSLVERGLKSLKKIRPDLNRNHYYQ